MLRLIKRIILYLIFSNSILAYFARRVFWGRRIFKKLSTPETNFLLNLNFLGKVVYDIGSFTGGFTQFAAASVGKKGYVVAFEPNPKTYQVIKENIGRGIDSNVKVINTGVGLKNGTCRLYVRNVGAGTGSIDPNIQHQIVSEGDFYELDAPICSLDSFVLDQDQPPKFINIDAEGAEFDILKGAINVIEQYHPEFFIEIHGATPELKNDNIQKIVYFLEDFYHLIYHVESRQEVSRKNYWIASEGHIYCK